MIHCYPCQRFKSCKGFISTFVKGGFLFNPDREGFLSNFVKGVYFQTLERRFLFNPFKEGFSSTLLNTSHSYSPYLSYAGGVRDTLSGVLALPKLRSGGDLPSNSLFQALLTGDQPQLDPGYPKHGRHGERER